MAEEETEVFAVPDHKTFIPWGKCGFVVQENFWDLVLYPLEFLLQTKKLYTELFEEKELKS